MNLAHKFVEGMPQKLEDGVIYVSIPFRIVSHNCCCGCGNEVVLNLAPSPKGWQVVFDGQTVSLNPSIGNFDFKCQSHYWITKNKVYWAEKWSDQKIRRAKASEALVFSEAEGSSQRKQKKGWKKWPGKKS